MNINDGDGCSKNCVSEPGWICDRQSSTCLVTCGDNYVVAGRETCDDGS